MVHDTSETGSTLVTC